MSLIQDPALDAAATHTCMHAPEQAWSKKKKRGARARQLCMFACADDEHSCVAISWRQSSSVQHAEIYWYWQCSSMTPAAGLLQPCAPAPPPAPARAGRCRSRLYARATGAEECVRRQRWGTNQWSRLLLEQHGRPQRALRPWQVAVSPACQAGSVVRSVSSAESQVARPCNLQRRLLLLLPMGLMVLQHQPAPAHADGGLSRYIKKRR